MNSVLILVVTHTHSLSVCDGKWILVKVILPLTSAFFCSFFIFCSFKKHWLFSLKVWKIYFNRVCKIITWLTEAYWCVLGKRSPFGIFRSRIWCVETVLGEFWEKLQSFIAEMKQWPTLLMVQWLCNLKDYNDPYSHPFTTRSLCKSSLLNVGNLQLNEIFDVQNISSHLSSHGYLFGVLNASGTSI